MNSCKEVRVKYSETNFMYELYLKSIRNPSALRSYVDPIVREVKQAAGPDADVHVSIEPECKDKRLYQVSIQVIGLSAPIVVKRVAKKPLSALRRARKAILRKLHQRTSRRLTLQRRRTGPHPLAAS